MKTLDDDRAMLERLEAEFAERGWRRSDFKMAWTVSAVFRIFVANAWGNTAAFDLDTSADSFLAALYNNTGTPDKDIAAASTAYNTGQWVLANEVSSAGQWAAGGVALAGQVVDVATSGTIMWDANDTASGSSATLANVFGVLVYDNTLASPVAKQGICFNYLGGTNSVTSGTFTVVWNANGIHRTTV